MKGTCIMIVLSMKLLMSLTTVAAIKTFPRALIPSTRLNKVAISVRGGAGPLNVKDTAKIAAYALGAQGAYGTLAPAKAIEIFGLPSNPLDNFLTKRSSVLIFSIFLLVWEAVFNKSDIYRVAGINSIPAAVDVMHTILNGDTSKFGFKTYSQYGLFAWFGLVAYICLTGSQYAGFFAKASAVFSILTFVFFYFFPDQTIKTFGRKEPVSTASRLPLKTIAVAHLSEGIMLAALLWGKDIDALKAVGYGWIPWVFFLADLLFVSKDERLNQNLLTAWFIFHSIVALTLAF